MGNQTSDAGWTLLATDTTVLPAQVGVPSRVRVPRLLLRAGTTYGFYIHVRSPSHSIEYSNGGPTPYSNADLATRRSASP